MPAQLPFTTCAYELSFFGINLNKLLGQQNKDFLFSEVGIGGGSYDGRWAFDTVLVGSVRKNVLFGNPMVVCLLPSVL